MRTTRTGPRRAGLVALVLAGGLAVSACSQAQLGAAAIIDGERLTVDRLQEVTRSLLDAAPEGEIDAGEAQRVTLTRFVVSRVIEKAAETAGVEATAGDLAIQRRQIEQAFGGSEQMEQGLAAQNIPPLFIDQFVRDITLSDALGRALVDNPDPAAEQERSARVNDLLLQTSAELDVEVNPRYGVWDPSGDIVPQISGGLAKEPDAFSESGESGESGPGADPHGHGHSHSDR
jgi:hypothetical protein